MSKLVYSAICSLDGYTADEAGDFEWAAPDAEVFAFVNDLERGYGTCLYGRRMYETLVYWETFDEPESSAVEQDFARLWRAADKVVYSRTLDKPSSARTRIERTFDPDIVRQLKETIGHDMAIGGPELAGHALAAGLVDEVQLFITPVTVGGGTAALPVPLRARLELGRVERFSSGVVYLQYRVIN